MANSDIIKIGFDYRASLAQFEKETNGVFDGISNKAGKQKITIQLDAKDDKVIDKIKELQKLKLDKFTFEFGNSGLKEQLQTFDKLENKINEIISLSKGIDLSFNTKNKTDAYNQLKKYADAFKDYYGNEEAMATNAGAKAGYAYYKAYEEALRKGVAQSKLEKVTIDFDVNDSFFSKERIVGNRIKEFENFQKYGNADESNLIAEITSLENRLLKFNSAYSQVKANLGDAPITSEITKNIEEYVRLLEVAESRAKDAELFGYSSEDINSDKDLANMYLDFAKEDATAENKKYIESLKQEETQAIATAEAEQKLAVAQKETVSNTSNSNNSQIEELKSDIQEVKTELGDVKDRISSIESNGFENVRDDVEKTKESVKELNSEFAEMKSNLSSTSQESNISSGMKDAFPSTEATVSVEKIADGFKEVKQETEKATESAKEYGKILSQVGLVGKKYNEFGEQIPSKYSYTRQTGENQVQTITVKFEKDKESGEIVEREIIGEYITGFQALEKEIDKADKKVFDLKKNLESNKIKLGDNYDTSALDKLIEDAENDASMLYEALKKVYSEQSEYEYSIAQYDDERAKKQASYNTQLENTKKIEEARAKNASDKKDESAEQKRQKSIEQTNRLLNKQQIIIDGIEKSYSKAANNDLDKAVNSQSDLAELANKKAEIQKLINQLTNQDRNSLNEDDFLLLEKYIAEYKQLAKDKLKANNPSKQELGGQELDVLLANQVTQYNKLISQSEKYGDATKEITNELKAQRDLIAEQDKNSVYVARSKKADGSEITANDYYDARDNYKINKSIFSSYETDIKSASNMAKQEASNIQAEWDKNIKAIQDYMDSMTKLNNLKAKDKGTGSEENQIALQIQNVKELKQAAWDARKNLSSMQAENPDIIAWKQWVDMMELFDQASKGSAESAAKLKDVLDNIKAPSLDKYENKLASYQTKKGAYDATIARFKDGGWTSDEYLKNVQAVKDAVKKYEDLLSNIKAKGGITSEEDVQKLKEYESEIKKTISTVTNMSAAEKGYNFVSAQKELDKIHKLLNENSKMSSEAKAKIQAYYREIESGNPSMSLDKIHGEILKIYNAEVEAGRAGRTLWDTMKNSGFHQIAAQMAGMFGVYDVINLGKQAFSTVKELDYALVDLKKTTAMNSSELEQFYYDSNDVAKQMGVTTKEIIDQASSWSRLGYNSKQAATEMAKLSSQFALISPGMDTTTSQEGLVSIMKAWNIGYQDVKSQIMDDINALGNAMAEDNQDIVEGMERSAAALAAVGTSTKDAFALFSGIQEVLQNSEKSGTSLRSVALRLRSFDETTGEYSEDLANITGELADLTKTAEHAQGVSVFKPGSTTEFKSLVDYFREIADIWDEMSQKQQNDFLLKAFGRTQAQAGAALIQNFKGVEKALDVMDNAAGSSDKEMETAKQSITYKLNELKQTWVGTVQDIANRDDLGKIVDGLIDLSSAIGFVIDKLGLVGTVGLFGGAGTGIFKFIKNFDWVFKPYTKTLSNSF